MDFVKKVIDEWDPIDLLSHAPDDEYHSEIEEIRYLLQMTDDSAELAEGIFNVFIESFGKDTFKKSKGECERIAQILLSLHGLHGPVLDSGTIQGENMGHRPVVPPTTD